MPARPVARRRVRVPFPSHHCPRELQRRGNLGAHGRHHGWQGASRNRSATKDRHRAKCHVDLAGGPSRHAPAQDPRRQSSSTSASRVGRGRTRSKGTPTSNTSTISSIRHFSARTGRPSAAPRRITGSIRTRSPLRPVRRKPPWSRAVDDSNSGALPRPPGGVLELIAEREGQHSIRRYFDQDQPRTCLRHDPAIVG